MFDLIGGVAVRRVAFDAGPSTGATAATGQQDPLGCLVVVAAVVGRVSAVAGPSVSGSASVFSSVRPVRPYYK